MTSKQSAKDMFAGRNIQHQFKEHLESNFLIANIDSVKKMDCDWREFDDF